MKINNQKLLLQCDTHLGCHYQFLSLTSKTAVRRLFCCQCLSDETIIPEEQKQQLIDIIPLSIVLRSPEQLIEKIANDDSKQLYDIYNFCQLDLEKQFVSCIESVTSDCEKDKQMEVQLRQQLYILYDRQIYLKKWRGELLERIHYNLFLEQLIELSRVKNQFESDQYRQLIICLQNTVEEIVRECHDIVKSQLKLIPNKNNELCPQNLEQYFEAFRQQVSEKLKQHIINQDAMNKDVIYEGLANEDTSKQVIINKDTPDEVIVNDDIENKDTSNEVIIINSGVFDNHKKQNNRDLSILSNAFSDTLIEKIQALAKKSIKNKALIYQGSQDGLNGQSFWNKVCGKSNLLMAFKSENNSVFGGYSPCKWNSNLNDYIADNSSSSFLFSQTHNEIYQIREDKKQFAILRYSCSNSGPTFGGGHDMYIDSGFKKGNSNLGHTYQWDKYQNKSSHHLFGDAHPNIAECEIYELTFE